jgi:Mor family transcriptional regulator
MCYNDTECTAFGGDSGAQIARGLSRTIAAVRCLLHRLYDQPLRPDQSHITKERNSQILARYAAGETQADLARAFGISYQRIHQIIEARNYQIRSRYKAGESITELAEAFELSCERIQHIVRRSRNKD